MIAPADCAALVTAAGESRRMGTPKALLAWGQRPLIDHQCELLSAFGRVVVVLGHDARRIRAQARLSGAVVVANARYREGRSTSIEAGMAAIDDGFRAVLVVAVDQPLAASTLTALLGGFDPATAAYAVPVTPAGRRGHPIVLARALFDELRRASEHPEGLRSVVRANAEARCEVPVEATAVLCDLNTPEAYREAAARWAPGGQK